MPFLPLFHGYAAWLRQDWHADKYACFGALLVVLTGIVEIAYYLTYPVPEIYADTPAYLHVVDRILTHPYLLVDTWRLPCYPLFVVLVYAFAGRGNLVAVGIAQAILFALATLECYLIAALIFKRAWVAFIIGLLIGTNVILISYIKPMMSEGMALWELTTLTLTLLWFIRTMRVCAFRCMVACLILLFLTRPEWVYLPVPLFVYLLLVVRRRGVLGHWLRRSLIALALIYTIVLTYVGINGLINQYFGLTAVANFNLLGKVLQYNMQDEASMQDATLSHQLDVVIAHVGKDPYHVLLYVPSLARDNEAPAGQFAQTIILHHPVEFIVKSVPLIFSSLTAYYDQSTESHLTVLSAPLAWLKAQDQLLYGWNILFPVCATIWLGLLCWRRVGKHHIVLEMGVIVLLALYGLIITTVGGYRLDDDMRLHIVFDPLLTLTIYGSLFMGAYLVVRWLARRFCFCERP